MLPRWSTDWSAWTRCRCRCVLSGRSMNSSCGGVRGDMATPGEFRRSQNWIGPPGCSLNDASYVPPPADELMGCLDDLEQFLHEETLPTIIHAGLAHAQFEAIHPFLDGNGRVGRLLITLLLVGRGILPSPLLYLSAYFEAAREEYYARLLAVTQEGAWETWLIYFSARRPGPGRGRTRPHPTHRRSIGALAGTTRRGSGRAPGASFGAVCRKPLLDRRWTCQGDERCLHDGPARR